MNIGKQTIYVEAANQRPDIPAEFFDACPKCGGELEVGYGLAGGGMGSYQYCPTCQRVVGKIQDAEE